MTSKEYVRATFDAEGPLGVLKYLEEILLELRDTWNDKDMRAVCIRDAKILADAAEEIAKPLGRNA